jgi:hypothetical protein
MLVGWFAASPMRTPRPDSSASSAAIPGRRQKQSRARDRPCTAFQTRRAQPQVAAGQLPDDRLVGIGRKALDRSPLGRAIRLLAHHDTFLAEAVANVRIHEAFVVDLGVDRTADIEEDRCRHVSALQVRRV